jgi:hypothetical protein
MKLIPTRVHGVLDYLVGLLLIAAPFVLGFADNTAAMWVPIILGAGTILYSLMTDYELGAFRVLSMPTHLIIDLVAGIFLAASPWLFGFADRVYLPHLVVGLLEIVVVILSDRVPAGRTATGTTTNTDRRGDTRMAH